MDNATQAALAARAVASVAAAAISARGATATGGPAGAAGARRRVAGPGGRLPVGSDIPPNQTLYCNNLNDRVSTNDLVANLFEYFAPYGEIIDIVAKKSEKKRGQAFVVFSELPAAAAAMRSLQGKAFLGRPMRICFAKTKSDAVMKLEGTFKVRKPGVGRQKGGGDASGGKAAGSDSHKNAAGKGGRDSRVTLFVEELPKEVNKKALDILFSQYPGHAESRLIEGRGVAFVDFVSQQQAEVAMQGLQGFKASPDRPIKISWAHQ